jgi:hypothetical protein
MLLRKNSVSGKPQETSVNCFVPLSAGRQPVWVSRGSRPYRIVCIKENGLSSDPLSCLAQFRSVFCSNVQCIRMSTHLYGAVSGMYKECEINSGGEESYSSCTVYLVVNQLLLLSKKFRFSVWGKQCKTSTLSVVVGLGEGYRTWTQPINFSTRGSVGKCVLPVGLKVICSFIFAVSAYHLVCLCKHEASFICSERSIESCS